MIHRWAATGLGCALMVVSELAAAQFPTANSEQWFIDQERSRLTAAFDAEEKACLTRFFATDCQNAVAARRRKALAELKRRERQLESTQREQRAKDQLQQIEKKRTDGLARQNQVPDPDAAPEVRLQRQADKRAAHAEKALQNQGVTQQKTVPTGPDSELRQRNMQAYEERKNALQKRREEREKRLQEHPNSGPPLPPEPL